MTFDSRETSRLDGRPFHLYDFKLGTDTVARYTNLATEFVFGGQTYEPLAISHGEITSAGNLDKSTLEITLPESGDVPDLYRDATPSDVVAIFIRQGHVGDLDMKVCWTGRAMGVSFSGPNMVIEGEAVTSSLRRPGLTRDYQYACPLVLYGESCRASRVAGLVTATVAASDGISVTLPSSWAAADRKDKFVGGVAEWTDTKGRRVRRSVVKRTGDVIRLASFGPDLVAGVVLTLVLGCNHTQDDCRNVHNNILNFGGQEAIPLINPIGITNNYY